jgi:amino acid transporter
MRNREKEYFIMDENKNNKVSLFVFIGMTCALVASIRNITNVAAAGWTMFAYMIIAIVLYTLPVAFISGEFAAEFPGDGGPENWVTSAIGPRWGMVTSWMLWVQMFPGMVMVGSVLAPMLATTISQPQLATNNIFTLVCILVVYWIVTLLNFKFDMAKIGGKIGTWLGIYIPVIFLFVGGLATLIKLGINPNGMLGNFDPALLVPDQQSAGTLNQLIPIMFIFTGIELSSVYMTRLKNPTKDYMKGVIAAMIFMALFNVVNGFLLANAINAKGGVQLNNIAQGFGAMMSVLGLPGWFTNVFALLVFLGVAVQLSAWATGPSKTITASARRGVYPPKFGWWKTNKLGVSRGVLLTQATVISLFSLLYLLVPAINTAFLLLTSATAIMYNVVYVIMGVAVWRARKTHPNINRPFKVAALGAVVTIMIIVIVAATIASFVTGTLMGAIIQLVITIVLIAIPLIVYANRKDSWRTDIEAALARGEGGVDQTAAVDVA